MVTTSYLFYGLNKSQQKALAIIPKCSASLSIIGSLYSLCKILERYPDSRRTYSGILLGLFSADLVASVALFLSTWPIPKGSIYSDYIWGEIGNQTTCNIQGFMIQLGALSSLMYTCSLCLHFLLRIRYKWLPSELGKVDPFIHCVCVVIPLGSAILAWIKTLYNPTGFGACYFTSYPIDCDDSTNSVNCIRGQNSNKYMLFLVQIPIFVGLLFIPATMVMIYLSVYKLDRSLPSARISRQTVCLACQYSSVFFIIYVPSAVISLLVVVMNKPVPFAPRAVHAFLAPLQGFLNSFVYSADTRSQLRYLAQSIRDIGMRRQEQESSDEEKEYNFARNSIADQVHEAAN